jgi:hypothetical protein
MQKQAGWVLDVFLVGVTLFCFLLLIDGCRFTPIQSIRKTVFSVDRIAPGVAEVGVNGHPFGQTWFAVSPSVARNLAVGDSVMVTKTESWIFGRSTFEIELVEE